VSTTSESGLRQAIRRQVLPVYPADSTVRGTQGVVVASVIVGTQGRIEDLQILESTDPAMADSVRAALPQWEFFPVVSNDKPAEPRVRLRGKLTFYFRIVDGRSTVLDPAGMASLQRGISPAPPRSG